MIKEKSNVKKKTAALIACFCMVISLFQFGAIPSFAGQKDNGVNVNIGVSDLNVSIAANGFKGENKVSDENGDVNLTDLYNYCESNLGWGSDTRTADTLAVTFDINYSETPAWQKNQQTNGNAAYKGKSGQFVLSYDGASGTYKVTDDIKIDAPDKESFVKGAVKVIPYGETEAKVLQSASVVMKGGNGNDITLTTDSEGKFDMTPDVTESVAGSENITVKSGANYDSKTVSYSDFKTAGNVITVAGKYTASADVDYTYGENISNGYVAKADKYTINAGSGCSISATQTGDFTKSISVTVDAAGGCTPFYVKNSKGDISTAVENALKLDTEGPTLSAVKNVSGTASLKDYGIYSSSATELNTTITAVDNKSGVKTMYLTGTDSKGNTKKYEPKDSSLSKNGDDYNASFDIGTDDIPLSQVLTITVVDNLGNESSAFLLRGTEQKSLITIENDKPIIGDVEVQDNDSNKIDPNSNGWYNKAVKLACNVQDEGSGLSNVEIKVNGISMKQDSFAVVDKTKKSYTVALDEASLKTLASDGIYNVVITAVDNCGNTSEKKFQLKDDITAPVVSFNDISNNGAYTSPEEGSVAIDETGLHGSRIHLKISNADNIVLNEQDINMEGKTSAKLPSTFTYDGKYTIEAYAIDQAGNKSETKSITITKDTTAPVIKTSASGIKSENGWYKDEFKYDIDTNDSGSGLVKISATVNGNKVIDENLSGEENKAAEIYFNDQNIQKYINDEGTYNIVIKAIDRAGNIQTKIETLKIDRIAPEVTISGIDSNKHYSETPTLAVKNNEKHYTEKGAFINVVILRDNKTVSNTNYKSANHIDISSFGKDGNYQVKVSAYDAAGNVSKCKEISFVKDSTAPSLSISGASGNSYYQSARTISVKAIERYYKTDKVNVTVSRSLNGKTTVSHMPWSNKGVTSVNTISCGSTGTYTISANAIDEAGNKASAKPLKFTVDSQKPVISISGVTEKVYGAGSKVAPSVSISDSYLATAGITLTKNGRQISMPSSMSKVSMGQIIRFSNFANKAKNDGIYVLNAKAKDKSGNFATKKISFSVNRFGSTYEYGNAVKSINGKSTKQISDDLVIYEYNVSKITDSKSEIRRDGSVIDSSAVKTTNETSNGVKVIKHTFPKSEFSKDGIYTLNIISKDNAGNTAESEKKAGGIKFYVDNSAPVITTKGLGTSVINSNKQKVTVNATDNMSDPSLAITINGKNPSISKDKDGTVHFTIDKGINQHVVIKATDKAGNTNSINKTISVIPSGLIYFLYKCRYIITIGIAALIALFVGIKRKRK